MLLFFRRFLFLVAFLFAFLAYLLLPPTAWGEGRLPLPKKEGEASQKINLTSDRMEYRQEEEIYFAEGNATLTQGSMRLKVNTLWFNNKTKQLKGEGSVAFSENGNTIEASQIDLNLETQQGVLLDGSAFLAEENYYLTGKRIERLKVGYFDLHGATFTACNCRDDPDWQVKAKRLRVTLENYLEAKHLVFYAGGVPVVYLPYWIYPIKTTRQSGLLIPNMGYNSKHGFRYSQDLFLTLGQSQDLTLSYDYRDQKGRGGGLEYRYAFSNETRGALQTDFFEDIEKETDRVFIRYRHTQRFSNRVHMNLHGQYLNQESFFSELSDSSLDRALQSMESNASVIYTGDASFAYLQARYTQDLTQPNNDKALQRLPEMGWSLMAYPIGPFYFSAETTYSRFLREDGSVPWERLDFFPRVSWPIRVGSGTTLTPWYGYRPVAYSQSAQTSDFFDRNAIVKAVDLNSEWGGVRGRLSNRLIYEQIRAEDRFDVFQADDLDRIHSRESVTLSLNPRLLKKGRGGEWASIRLTETVHMEPVSPSIGEYSDLRGELSVHPTSAFAFNVDTFYNWEDQKIPALRADLHLNLWDHLKVSIGERFTRGGVLPQKGDPFNPLYLGDLLPEPASRVEFMTGRLLAKLGGSLRFATQVYYDKTGETPIETHYGFLYLKQCWSVILAYQELPNRNEVSFAVHLTGFGSTFPKRFSYLFDY